MTTIMKKFNVPFLILAVLIITVQMTLTGCNKKEEVSTAKDSVGTTPPVVKADAPVNQGQTSQDEKDKASNQKIVVTKERDVKTKKVGDDRHMRDTTTIKPPVMPQTQEEKDRQNTIMKQNEADAKRKEIERRKRLNQ